MAGGRAGRVGPSGEEAAWRSGPRLLLAAALLVWAVAAFPLASGQRTLYYRDVFSNHLPQKAFGAAQLLQGRIPAVNPAWGLGQPFRGNPSTLPYYPDNLLYLFLPFWSAFNLHFVLHWLLALLTMRRLAQELGQDPLASLVAGICYAGSGWLLSTLCFYNLVTVAGWWPLVLAGAARGGRRGVGVGGVACGLAFLGGEPVTAGLGLVPLLLVAVRRRGWRRGTLESAALVAVGVAIALPQLVATFRVLPETTRGAAGMVAEQVRGFSLHPARLLELLVPFPFGLPGRLGPERFWGLDFAPALPFFLSLYPGIVAFWLATRQIGRHRDWALLGGAGLIAAWLLGLGGEAVTTLTAGLFRYPEKLALWPALALPLLAGWGVEDVGEGRGRWLAAVAGGFLVVFGCGLLLAAPRLVTAVTSRLPAGAEARGAAFLTAQLGLQTRSLVAGGGLSLLAAWAIWRRSGLTVGALQLFALLQLHPLLLTDRAQPYEHPPAWSAELPADAAVVPTFLLRPSWPSAGQGAVEHTTGAEVRRDQAADLAPTPGVLFGLRYPLAPDLEGMGLLRHALRLQLLAEADGRARLAWLRAAGVDALVVRGETAAPGPGLIEVAAEQRGGTVSRLFRLPGPHPLAWWPEAVEGTGGVEGTVRKLAAGGDAVRRVWTPLPVEHHPGGTVEVLTAAPDHLELAVDSPGGLLVVRRAFSALYRARSGQVALLTLPVDLELLGVVVPRGSHRVVVAISSRPESWAAAVAALVLVGALGLAWRGDDQAAKPSASR